MLYLDQPFLVKWVELVGFSRVLFAKPVSVGLVDKLFQPASNQVKTIDKAFA